MAYLWNICRTEPEARGEQAELKAKGINSRISKVGARAYQIWAEASLSELRAKNPDEIITPVQMAPAPVQQTAIAAPAPAPAASPAPSKGMDGSTKILLGLGAVILGLGIPAALILTKTGPFAEASGEQSGSVEPYVPDAMDYQIDQQIQAGIQAQKQAILDATIAQQNAEQRTASLLLTMQIGQSALNSSTQVTNGKTTYSDIKTDKIEILPPETVLPRAEPPVPIITIGDTNAALYIIGPFTANATGGFPSANKKVEELIALNWNAGRVPMPDHPDQKLVKVIGRLK